MTICVVGGGIAGLAAAWELAAGSGERGAGRDVVVLEAERRAGGVIVTERRDGFVVEGGPDSVLAAEPEIPELAAELGMADRLVEQTSRGSFVWTGDAMRPLAEGEAAALLGIEARGEDVARGFRSFGGGMGEVVAALVARLGGALRIAQGVAGLSPSATGWRLAITGGSVLAADAVVLALPAYAAARLLDQAGVWGARILDQARYLPSVTVSLAYHARQVGRPLEGTGFVTAPDAAGPVRACTYASAKFPGRAPEGDVLVRAFLAPATGDPGALAHAALAPILEIRGTPLWARAFEWPRGLPRYSEGHAARVAEVRRRLLRLAPLAICGAGYDGPGVSACVRSGRAAAAAVLGRLQG